MKLWRNQLEVYIVLEKVLTIFLYDPIVHTDYLFFYIANYLHHLIKELLITAFTITVNFLSENSAPLPRLTKTS